jgi:arylsulfatase A-like enzyme
MGVMDTSVPFLTDAAGKPQRYPLNDFYRTPNMERLAASGIRFNNFYAMSVCSPTRISLLTGQNAARHRTTNWIDPDQNNAGPQGPPDWNWRGLKRGDVTLASLLRDAGYRTLHVGKGHFGPRASEGANPANLGFDINVAGASFGAPGSYYGQRNYGAGTPRAKSAVPHLDPYHGHVPHRGTDAGSQREGERRRPSRPAVLPLPRALRRSRALRVRSTLRRQLRPFRQIQRRAGLRYAH